jgi:hypothetical protein
MNQGTDIIRKVKGGYVLFSSSGKRLSKPGSKAAAHKREAEVEWFKNHPKLARKKR